MRLVPVCLAITKEFYDEFYGSTSTHTIIVKTKIVLQLLLGPEEYDERTQFNALSSSLKGLS